jgi:amidase
VSTSAGDLAGLDAVAQAELIRRREASPTELVTAAIERIEAVNPRLNAVVSTTFEAALASAADGPRGRFGGVPYLLKDLVVEVEGTPFTEGSRFLRDNTSRFTSELAARLARAGLIVVGRTNTPEFGLMPACEPLLHGPCRNPWDVERSTSGSSGGSAAAVASGMVPMGHATDLGGSIRYPASACGLFGLKPTRARVPLGPEYGDAISGWAVEHAVTRTVRDSAALLDVEAGPMLGDPYHAPPVAGPFADEVGRDPGRLRIAWTAKTAEGDVGHPDCVAAVEDAASLCASLGHDVVETTMPALTPDVGAAIGTVFGGAAAWIVGYWVRHLGREPERDELEPLTRAYLEAGRQVTAGDYLLAIGDVQAFGRRVAAFLSGAPDGFDVFLTPTLSEPPLPIGEMTSTDEDPLRALRSGGRTVRYAAVIANMTGNPAMSVPLWWNGDGLPIGVHVLGRFGDEATLVRLAAQFEAARPWADRTPPIHALTP